MNTCPIPVPLAEIQAASQHHYRPGQNEADLTGIVEGVLLHQITHQPRSLQKRIGPSEIGTPCQHCLAAKLAGWEQTQEGIPWASTVGTAIHALIEEFIGAHNLAAENAAPGTPFRFFTEQKVTVGTIGGEAISGSIDLLDVATGSTVDWKCVSPSSLTNYKKKGPSDTYRVQAHLYAKGCNDAGIPVERVSICFLPRASNNFYQRVWWSEPYNPQVAEQALTRANTLAANLQVLESVSVQARDDYISGLPRAQGCWDCARYADAPPKQEGFGLPTSTATTQSK